MKCDWDYTNRLPWPTSLKPRPPRTPRTRFAADVRSSELCYDRFYLYTLDVHFYPRLYNIAAIHKFSYLLTQTTYRSYGKRSLEENSASLRDEVSAWPITFNLNCVNIRQTSCILMRYRITLLCFRYLKAQKPLTSMVQ
jgi:hypothetical protein